MISDFDVLRKEKTRWGVFLIIDDKIKYEEWATPTELVSVKKSSGYIENDTILHITEHFFTYNGEKYPVNEVWHFRQFSPKPDSTNVYIK